MKSRTSAVRAFHSTNAESLTYISLCLTPRSAKIYELDIVLIVAFKMIDEENEATSYLNLVAACDKCAYLKPRVFPGSG